MWEGFSDLDLPEDQLRAEGQLSTPKSDVISTDPPPPLNSEVITNGLPTTLESQVLATDQLPTLLSEELFTGSAPMSEAVLAKPVLALKPEAPVRVPAVEPGAEGSRSKRCECIHLVILYDY